MNNRPSHPRIGCRHVNGEDRACLVVDDRLVDIADASNGALESDPMTLWSRMPDVRDLAASIALTGDEPGIDAFTCPVPAPTQVFGIGLNYRAHAAETGNEPPKAPMVFAKFPSSLTGPGAELPITGPAIDWEAELVVVMGTAGRDIAHADAWAHVAGLTAGQDVSDRILQTAGARPQFALGKSKANHSPIGPVVVDVAAFDNPDDLELWCEIDGEEVQRSRTSDLIFDVSELIAYLSSIVELRPGDLIFTGTPSGVGAGRDPRRFLVPGETVTTGVEGIGTFDVRCVEA